MGEFMSKEEETIRSILNQSLATLLSKNDIANYSNLIAFVDGSLSEAYKLSGDDRAEYLVKALLNIRSFLNSELITENSKKLIIANANRFVDEIYWEPEEEPKEEEKK